MTKKTRKEKELSRLRREIEILKAQTSGQNYSASEPQKEEKAPSPVPASTILKPLNIRRVDPKYIKKDLIKTAVLSLLALAVIAALYLLRNQIPFL